LNCTPAEGHRFTAFSSLIGQRLTNARYSVITRRAKANEVLAGGCETQLSIRSASDFVSLVIVLAVIFPKADWADLVPAA
jgi:hypothetical protein